MTADLNDKPENDNEKEIRLDGFSSKEKKQAFVPDYLFWGEHKGINLSEELDNPRKKNETVHGIIDILNSYKFTIEENTPLEEEIALDPELLGKVFESLLAYYNPETKANARKQTGSFYTPREIVNYMVDESLIAAFQQKLSDAGITENIDQSLRDLISYNRTNNPFTEKVTINNAVIEALENLKVLDPACGSGAFPMGILHKLVWVLKKVDPENKKWFESIIKRLPDYAQPEMRKKLEGENWDYLRKLGIIQQSVYGVDIQPIAIQIAKLRFFISLLVDQDIKGNADNNFGLQPLPNLDFKLVSANTLIGVPEQIHQADGLGLFVQDDYFDKFNALTGQYFGTYEPAEKKKLTKKIEKLVSSKVQEKVDEISRLSTHADERFSKQVAEKNKAIIEQKKSDAKLWESYNNLFKHESVGFFDTKYFFPEVKEGFDVVIGNPPWVSLIGKHGIEDNINSKDVYLRLYEANTYMPNLYEFFLQKGLSLIIKCGHLCYIIPDRFGFNESFISLRRKVLSENSILQIIYRWKFESIIADTMTLLVRRGFNPNNQILISYRPEDEPLQTAQQIILSTSDVALRAYKNPEIKKLVEKIQMVSSPLRLIAKSTSGFGGKSAKITTTRTNKQQIPIIKGASIQRYAIEKNFYFEFKEEYLSGRTRDTNKLGRKEKVLLRKTGDQIISTYDDSGIYPEQSLYFLYDIAQNIQPKYLLGLLNSTLISWYYLNFLVTNIDSTPQLKNYDLDAIPIVITKNQEHRVKLVDQILAAKKKDPKADTSALEKQIDEMVYALYGLTPEEIAIVEGKK